MKNATILSLAVICLGAAAQADPIKTFQQLCLANAGNPTAIIAAGKRAGFDMRTVGKNSALGMRDKSGESLQVNVFTKHKFECAVTTSDMPNPSKVSSEFFGALGLSARRGLARGSVRGKTYSFMHDTKGGEAFVMFAN